MHTFVYLFIIIPILYSHHALSQVTIAVLGLGGRAQYVLRDCLKFDKDIKVVAICDDYALESLNFFINKLEKENDNLVNDYRKMFDKVAIYADNDEGLHKLFEIHKNIDQIFITSANYNHFRYLNAALAYSFCKNIYIEKPLFRNMQEFNSFTLDANRPILVGLTLRYSTMSRIVVDKLREYQVRLGELICVKSWERVRFCQALTSFMMSWRRFISLSGGLLLEKSIHDLDLALFFIHSLNVTPKDIYLRTVASHNFFKKSQKQKIIDRILHDAEIQKTLIGRDRSPFQRLIDFTFNADKSIDWVSTINAIFENLPDSDNFNNSDVIPDYHQLHGTIKTSTNKLINFELEVELGGFRSNTERGMHFAFEQGSVSIDIMKSCMTILLNNGDSFIFDLQTNNNDHADGDKYIAQAILGLLPEQAYTASFTDPVVQLATFIGLESEHQALHMKKSESHIEIINGKWQRISDIIASL